ncbi:MAG: cupredoxin domain-containing protein [Coriobacteriales bacterium]|nr:cupredoxin domain-containing protein [Coriobacteriales bacterium]
MESILKSVYRIDVAETKCWSTNALAELNLREVDGVASVKALEDKTIVVVTDTPRDLYEDIVRAVVHSGLDPENVAVCDFERRVDPRTLPYEEAVRLGLAEPPREPVRAEVEQVQRISIHVTDGYDPDQIIISAGVPAELTFSEGHGCLGRVVFDDLGIDVSLESGGAVVRIPGLEPGVYGFRCGMNMVHGTLIVE